MAKAQRTIFEAIAQGDAQRVAHLVHTRPVTAQRRNTIAARQTALMCAAQIGRAQCVQILIPASDLLAQDGMGRTALMLAVQNEQLECAQILAHVQDPFLILSAEGSPVHLAVMQGNLQALAALLTPMNDRIVQWDSGAGTLFRHLRQTWGLVGTLGVFTPAVWACVDQLSSFCELRKTAREFLLLAPSGALPQFLARLEREALQTVVSPSASPCPVSARSGSLAETTVKAGQNARRL